MSIYLCRIRIHISIGLHRYEDNAPTLFIGHAGIKVPRMHHFLKMNELNAIEIKGECTSVHIL